MEFITENYVLIMGISIFLIFALIGYIVDTNNKKNKNDSNLLNNGMIDVNKTVNGTVKQDPVIPTKIIEEKVEISDKDVSKIKDKK